MTGHHRPSKGTRIEQAIAYGRPYKWILEHLDCTLADYSAAQLRIHEAASEDTEALFEPTPALVHAARPTSLTRPHGTRSARARHKRHGETPCDECAAAEREYQAARPPRARQTPKRTIAEYNAERTKASAERVVVIRALAADGLLDWQIAVQLDLTSASVGAIRSRNGIPHPRRTSAPIDELAVQQIMSGELRLAPDGSRTHVDLIEAIRRLFALGLNDTEIGLCVGRSGRSVCTIRSRHGITAQRAAS